MSSRGKLLVTMCTTTNNRNYTSEDNYEIDTKRRKSFFELEDNVSESSFSNPSNNESYSNSRPQTSTNVLATNPDGRKISENFCDVNFKNVTDYSNGSSDVDDSDADPDYDPALENRRHKTYFNLQNLCDSPGSGFTSLSTKLNLPCTTEYQQPCDIEENPFKLSTNNIAVEEDNVENICKEILTNILNEICSKKTTKKRKKANGFEKYPLLPACNRNCRRTCSKKMSDLERNNIRKVFWKLTFGERRLFFDSHIKQDNVKTRSQDALTSKRNYSLKYWLPVKHDNSDIEDIQVCKTMFLHTLGLKTDGMITAHLRDKRNAEDGIAKTKDNRGIVARSKMQVQKLNHEVAVIAHINSFNPVVSHYNLKHAPNRRYLSSELTVSYLWKDFCQSQNVGYDLYRSIFNKQNIGFSKPSQDECETCKVYGFHNDGQNLECNCKHCSCFLEHKSHYTIARQEYNADKERKLRSNEKLYSVDMQKVLLLPKMSTKNSFFLSRLVVFNETFASLGNDENICVMWHEAIRGRCASDVTSAYYNVIKNCSSEVTKFTFWVDNCSAQNKNWTLYSSFICFVNSEWGPEEITLKYFEPGHSYMAADSVHGRISIEMKKYPNIYDFKQLLSIIQKSSKRTKCLVLSISDFFPFKDGVKQRKNNNIPLLEDLKIVQFRKGSTSLFYKKNMSATMFTESLFLKTKFETKLPSSPYLEPLGIKNTDKKEKILKVLCPSFDDERRKLFWIYLPSNNTSRDLCVTSEK